MNVYLKKPEHPAEACVIWLHGLGADASDMVGLAEQLMLNDVSVRHVFLDAPIRPVTLNAGMAMRAWYDVIGLSSMDREDEEGILQSVAIIEEQISLQIEQGFPSHKIFLAGFSQGGAMALYTALQKKEPLAGIIALSAYLPLANQCKAKAPTPTPFFLTGGQYDPLILPAWTETTAGWLRDKGYENLTFRTYSMEHAVCLEEIQDLSVWLATTVRGE